MPKVCSTTLQAVLPTMSPTSASASSIWSRASWETTSAYWSTHPSTVVRASLRNSGKSSANCRPWSTVGGMTAMRTPARTASATR